MADFPDGREARVINPILTDFVSGLMQEPNEFVADEFFDVKRDAPRTGQVFLLDTEEDLGDDDVDLERAPGSRFKRDQGYAPSLTSFRIRNYGRERGLPDETQDDSQLPFPLANKYIRNLLNIVRTARERRFAAFLNDSARYTTTTISATSVPWNQLGSDPMADLDAMWQRLELAGSNVKPNALLFARAEGYALAANKKFRDDLSITRDKTGSVEWPLIVEKLSAHFGLAPDRIKWAKAVGKTNKRNLTKATAAIHDGYVWMGRAGGAEPVSTEGGIMVTAAAAFYARRMPPGELPQTEATDLPDVYVSQYRSEETKEAILRVEHNESLVPLRNDTGQLLQGVLT